MFYGATSKYVSKDAAAIKKLPQSQQEIEECCSVLFCLEALFVCYYKVEQNVFLLAKTQCISSVFNGCILSDWTSLVSMMALVPLISTQHPNSFTVGNPTVLLANFTAEKKLDLV